MSLVDSPLTLQSSDRQLLEGFAWAKARAPARSAWLP